MATIDDRADLLELALQWRAKAPGKPITDAAIRKLIGGDLEHAARVYATEAEKHGDEGQWWMVWRRLEELRGVSPDQSIRSLSPQQRRWYAGWCFLRGDVDAAIVSYRAYLEGPDGIGPFAQENVTYLAYLVKRNQIDDVLALVNALGAEPAEAPLERCIAAWALVEAGMFDDALSLIEPVRRRYHEMGGPLGVTAIALARKGDAAGARSAALEAAELEFFDTPLFPRWYEGLDTARALWSSLQRAVKEELRLREDECRGQPMPSFDEAFLAWREDPGFCLVPSPEPTPHTYAGDAFHMPDCLGCGRPIRELLTVDLREVPSRHRSLDGWSLFPLLGCPDCLSWMGRHDYALDADGRTIRLLDVALRSDLCGEPTATPTVLVRGPARLVRIEAAHDLAPDPHIIGPQVGGAPLWTQQPERVRCRSCRREMRFVASMVSTYDFTPPVYINNESGAQYHFACGACRTISVIAQWT